MSEWKNRIKGFAEVDPRELIANPNNIKEHPEYQRRVIDGVLDDLGWLQGVIVNVTTGHILDGHMRVEDAIAKEQPSVPVTYVEISEEEENKALLTFDPVSTLARQSTERVNAIIRDVSLSSGAAMDFVRGIAKTHNIDMSKYTDVAVAEPVAPADPTAEMDWSVQPGDLYEAVGNGLSHRLICGDNSKPAMWDRLLQHTRPVLAVTSPPYNQAINKFTASGMQTENTKFVDRMADSYDDDKPEELYQQEQIEMVDFICSRLASNGSLFYNHKIRYRDKHIVSPLEWLSRISYPIRQEIIWDRGSAIAMNARMFIPCDERIYWIRVGDDFVFNDETEIKAWSVVWRFAARNEVKQSAAFPYELPYRCIIACSKEGDAVIDPYLGSGTTVVAANRTGRVGYGIERDVRHFNACLNRLAADGLKVRKL